MRSAASPEGCRFAIVAGDKTVIEGSLIEGSLTNRFMQV
jgi:hypothetical protein